MFYIFSKSSLDRGPERLRGICIVRISEGLQLRVKDLDFDHGTIIVREGKGSKDRALMLPESLAPSLREQGN